LAVTDERDLGILRATYACPCDESAMFDEPLYPARASGMWVWAEGQSTPYLDLVLGYSSLNFGHCNPRIAEAVADAATNLTQIHSFNTRDKLVLSQHLATAIPGEREYQVYFDVGGSSIVGGALRLCRASTGRRMVATYAGAFHGTGYLAATITDPALLDRSQYGLGSLSDDVVTLPYADRYGSVSTDRSLAALDRAISDYDLAAVIVEPVQGAGGFIMPHDDFLARLRERTASADVRLIVDDIQMGVGRTGALFSFARTGIDPDIVLLSKSLAGGYYPLSALIADTALFADVPAVGTAFQSTFNNNPFGIAIARRTLEIAQEDQVFENARVQGAKLLAELAFLEVSPFINRLRGDGLAIAFDFDDRQGVPNAQLARLFAQCALEEHVLVYACGVHRSVVKVAPELAIDEDGIAIVIDALIRCLRRFEAST
jgi:4-aminobutyrate aminotransferase-like enzyme